MKKEKSTHRGVSQKIKNEGLWNGFQWRERNLWHVQRKGAIRTDENLNCQHNLKIQITFRILNWTLRNILEFQFWNVWFLRFNRGFWPSEMWGSVAEKVIPRIWNGSFAPRSVVFQHARKRAVTQCHILEDRNPHFETLCRNVVVLYVSTVTSWQQFNAHALLAIRGIPAVDGGEWPA